MLRDYAEEEKITYSMGELFMDTLFGKALMFGKHKELIQLRKKRPRLNSKMYFLWKNINKWSIRI